ncbi:tyrosine-type recombinase/integrase [Actinoallomurus bryophytorum]|uniref:Site-specific recombinase XerD n=1 Tax=Actinoallomurus bryophytorum TaxID=1490222 RepID=A0A543BTB8_9ACTN|nr:tyrosine-type recombinase/integrase [Actinoallomurus bryophytorum]TQL88083.1 site-specific recombinase XerD [Actinoallomurus bryophytorum]
MTTHAGELSPGREPVARKGGASAAAPAVTGRTAGGERAVDGWGGPETPLLYDPERDPYRVYLDRLDSAGSRRTMRGCLDRIARIIAMDASVTGAGRPWWLLRYEHTTRIRAELRNRTGENGGPAYSPASVNKHLVALRQVLRECWRLGLMSAEDYQRAADLQSVEGSRLPRGHHLPGEALGAVLAVCAADTSPAGARDGALLAVLYTTGARRAEIAGLALADYDPSERSLRVRGKRGKERLVYVTVEAAARLDAWIAVRGRTPGALFPPISRGGRCRGTDGRLAHPTGQAIAGILTRRLEQAEVAPHTPHDFRRTFIGELLDAGVDLATAQQLAGHASPATTARYDRRPQRRRREAVDRLRLP